MIYVFDDYEVDTERYELRLRGTPLRIQPKAFELLVYLIQHEGQFISKENLRAHLWPDQLVSATALTYCVTAVRRAVGDTGRAQRVIKTVYGRGYRFIAPIRQRSPATPPEETPLALIPHAEEQSSHPLPMPAEPTAPAVTAEANNSIGAQSSSVAERRQLTVMRCRVLVTPVHSEPLDPEDLHEVMQEARRAYMEGVQPFEGHITQHFSDGCMVYFGYPHAHEDDARRAVQASLTIVSALQSVHTTLEHTQGLQLSVRVGIHTGLVIVETAGSKDTPEYLVLGDTPHIAAQLADLAVSNTVVISAATLKLVEGYFVYQTLGAHRLADLPQPLPLYQVVRQSPTQSRLAVARVTGLTPFVGREHEISLLRERWEQAKEGSGQVVLLSSEAGIGKSRLVQMHYDHIAGETFTHIESRCIPYYHNSTLFPIIDLVQHRMQWNQDEPPLEQWRKLQNVLRVSGAALEEIMPFMAPLFSLPLPVPYTSSTLTPPQKQKTLEVLLAWLLQEAEQQPTCLVIEDLQWADPSTLDFLTLLLHQMPTVRMLIILTCRSDFCPPWAMRSHHTHIALNRLTQSQVERMIRHITRGKSLPAEILRQLVVKSDGVPLFAEEMTRMVLEAGLVTERDDQYELVGDLPPLAIPATLHGSLMARLDRLDIGKSVAQLGATLGREFSYELLHAVTPLDEPTLRRGLTRLVEAELLYQRGFPPQARYIFKHALIQEAAHQSLLRSTRQRYHKQIAEVLATQFPDVCDNQPELLAHHYTEAGLSRQAVTDWQRAGQTAMARSAHLEAIAHFRQALALNATLTDAAERQQRELSLQTTLGVVLAATQGYAAPDVEAAYTRAQELCQRIGDTTQLFTVLRGLWLVHLVRGTLQTAYALGEQLLQLTQRTQETTLLLEAHRALGTSLFLRGEFASAWTHLEQGIRLYDVARHRDLAIHYGQDSGASYLGYAAWTLWMQGYAQQSLRYIHDALALAQQLKHPYSQGFALTFAAWLCQWRREPQAVLHHATASMALAREHQFPLLLAHGMILQGWSRIMHAQQAEGLEQIRQGLAAYQATGTGLARSYLLTLLAEGLWKAGQLDAALAALTEAASLAEKQDEHWWQAEIYRLQGELLLHREPAAVAQAEALLQQARHIAHHQQARLLELRATMSLCRLWQQQGKEAGARYVLKDIYAWFTEGFDTADLAEAAALLEALA
jgi:predicted ATPase/DNA-binding winged helix-turn-helix (wHTH) protein